MNNSTSMNRRRTRSGREDLHFQAANVDEQGNEISRGELELTDEKLVYRMPRQSAAWWPLTSIRRWGLDDGCRFVFEAGRSSPTGEAFFAFHLGDRGPELVERLSEKTKTTTSSSGRAIAVGHPANSTRLATAAATATAFAEAGQYYQPVTIPCSYSQIDFHTTTALLESAQAHAASRNR